MEFIASMVRSCRMKRIEKELDRQYLAELGVSRLGLLTDEPLLGAEISPRSYRSSKINQ
jgi:hypothetical protein